MTTITGVNHSLFTNRTSLQASDAAQTAEQLLNSYSATSAGGGPAPQIGTGSNAPTGSSAAPLLSSSVVGALINVQAQQSAGNSAGSVFGTEASNSSSAPLNSQQIASQFDLHNLTNGQFESIAKDLAASGTFSTGDILNIATKLGGGDQFLGALEGRQTQPGQITSIWNGVDNNKQPFDAIQKIKSWLTSDTAQQHPQAEIQSDQTVLNALNSLDRLRNGDTA
jgi:hypothetical protein